MRILAVAALLAAGCYDFQEARRNEDAFTRRPPVSFRLTVDRVSFPAGDVKVLEAFLAVRSRIAGGAAWTPNGMGAWTLKAGWPPAECEAGWKVERSIFIARGGEPARIVLVERLDPPLQGDLRIAGSGGGEIERLSVSATRISFRAELAQAGPLVDLDLLPIVIDEAGREHPLAALASRFSLEPGSFHLFTAKAAVPGSAGTFLFGGLSHRRVAIAIAVEVEGDSALK